MDAGSLYAGGRNRIAELVGDLPPSELDRPAPATPGWTVKDVVGHLAGVAADVTAGRMAGAGTPAWTAAQVDARRSRDLAGVLDEWASLAPGLEAMLAGAPTAVANRIVCDVACHEHDIRGALGRPGARDSDTVDLALQAGVDYLDRGLRDAGAPGLTVRSEHTEWFVGQDPPAATLTAEPFTLFRLLFGRRSLAQMAALDWTGSPDLYLDHLSVFDPAVDDIDE